MQLLFCPECFGTFALWFFLFHFISFHMSIPICGQGWMPLLFHKRIVAVTIKPLLVSWNSLIGWRGLSRLVKWEVGYMIITPTANFVISGHTEHVVRWRIFKNIFSLCAHFTTEGAFVCSCAGVVLTLISYLPTHHSSLGLLIPAVCMWLG